MKNIALLGSGAAILATLGGAFGGYTVIQLKEETDKAKTQLAVANVTVNAYREHILRKVFEDMAEAMASVSTQWLRDAERPLGAALRSDREIVESLLKLNASDAQLTPATTEELRIVLALFNAMAKLADNPPSVKDTTRMALDEKEWADMKQNLLAVDKKKVDAGRLGTYMAYVANAQGVFAHQRYRHARTQSPRNESLAYWTKARELFNEASKHDKAYSPALSNLGVVLLDAIEDKTLGQGAFEKEAVKDADFDTAEQKLTAARDLQQPPLSQSRTINNLAYSQLQRALLLVQQGKHKAALDRLQDADAYANDALNQSRFVNTALATGAEIKAYRAFVKAEAGMPVTEEELAEPIAWLERAKARKYPFDADKKTFLANSPAFSAFFTRFATKTDAVLKAAGVKP